MTIETIQQCERRERKLRYGVRRGEVRRRGAWTAACAATCAILGCTNAGGGAPGRELSIRRGDGGGDARAPAPHAGFDGFGNAPVSGTGGPSLPMGPQATRPDPAAGECGAVSQMAQNKLQPVDLIIGVDTSGSMAEEVAEVQANLNAFSRQVIDSGIDVSVILLSSLQGSALVPLTVDGPCIAAPLGSGTCPDDSNHPAYVHVNTPVGSWDALDVYVNTYPQYRQYLRENSLKTFVTITDDNATSPFGGEPPVVNTADEFIAAVEGFEPAGSQLWSSWRYSAIYCFTACPAASLVGTVHAELVDRTQGVGGDLCLQDFAPVFDELARQVAEVVTLACDWDIPPSPQGETFDANKTNVRVVLDGAAEDLSKAPSAADCGDNQGWYYDDEGEPTRVVACPATCNRIQASADAQVDLLFGCETVVLPVL